MSTDRESLTLTFVFTDIVGSTDLIQALGEDRARVVFERHHQSLARDVAAHGGEELEWLGDGMLASFASSSRAVRCALAMQRRSHRRVGGQELQIRIGVHTGEAMRRAGGYFGNTVVIARRLCDTAAAGQILTSGFVASMLAGRQFGFREIGSIELKGITQPVAVFEVTQARRDADTAADAAPAAPAAGARVRGRRRLALVGGVAVLALFTVVAILAAAGALAPLLGGGATPGGSPGAGGDHRSAVIQLLPLVLWRDASGGVETFGDSIAWASGTIVDERGVIVTSQAAIDPRTYGRPFDAFGVAFADASGLSSRPTHLAQVIGVNEGGSELAVLLITCDIDGRAVASRFSAAAVGDPTLVARDERLELVGFPSGAEVSLRVAQTTRTSDADHFKQVGGRLALIETGAQLTDGDRGGGAFHGGRLIGVLAPGTAGTAAARPIDFADGMIARARTLLDAATAGTNPAVTLAVSPPPPHALEIVAEAAVSGMVDGTPWSWSCSGPDGDLVSGSWPPRLAWTAGSGNVHVELRCQRWDGLELDPGSYRVSVVRLAPDGAEAMLAEASAEVDAAAGEPRSYRALGWPPAFELEIPADLRCLSCNEPYAVIGRLTLETSDAQLNLTTYQGSDHETATPDDLVAALERPGFEITAGPDETDIDGQPGVRLEATVSRDYEGSGPFDGARFLAGTRGTWTFVAVDGIAFAISAETFETPGWEGRLAAMDEVVATLRFR